MTRRDEWAAQVVEETAVAQGFPFTITDPIALSNLGTVLASALTPSGGATGAAGSTRRARTSARAGQPKGSSAPARSNKTKAGVAHTTPAPNTSTSVEDVRRQA